MTTQTQKPKMSHFHCFLPVAMMDRLKAMSEETGAPVAVLVRRAIAAYLLGVK